MYIRNILTRQHKTKTNSSIQIGHGGFRFQYQTKRLWRKIVQTTLRTQDSVVEGLESGFAALGLLDAANETDDEDEDGADNGSDSPYVNHSHSTHRVEMGSLNRGVSTCWRISLFL